MTMKMQVVNPATGELIQELESWTPEQIAAAHEKAKEAQRSWRERPVKDRVAVLARFAELLQENQDRLASILTSEVGKPIWQSVNELRGARGRIDYFLSDSERWLAEETIVNERALQERISYEPLGVIANISAWNYPYLVGVNVFVPALIAGNAVLYKPSEFSSLTGLAIGGLLEQAGLPDALFQVVIGGGEVGSTLLDLPLDGYFFTGSHRTGKLIYEKVAPKMVPCQLELGGKDPMYITEDQENLEKVAEAAMEGAFYNNGQSCCAVERIYVHENVYEEFCKLLQEKVEALPVGLPTEEGVWIGPLTRSQQLEVLQAQVENANANGGQILTGGAALDRPGNYFAPTVIRDANHQMELMTEESFGPVIGVQSVRDDAEAVALMQDTRYGLTAAVYTREADRAEGILKQLNTGTVYWNCCDRVSPHVPWSGRNDSGFGLTLSYHGIRAFTQVKAWQFRP